MQNITLVTGNKNKLKEFQEILGDNLLSKDIDLPEIQSKNVEEVVEAKVRTAFEILQSPVIVEDVSFELEAWGGLPGPFIKFFDDTFPKMSLIKLLQGEKNRKGCAVACIGYYDGNELFTVRGEACGTITHELRGENGWGFDFCLIPEGDTRTFAEMTDEEKNARSHRARAIFHLQTELKKRNLLP